MTNLYKNAFNNRTITWDFEDGDGSLPRNVFGDCICETVNGPANPQSFQDHVDPLWDFYTYANDYYVNGILTPSVAPKADYINQKYATYVTGLNPTCWINRLFPNGNSPTFYHSVSTRGYGATYFSVTFGGPFNYINCLGDLNEPCFPEPRTNEQRYLYEVYSICEGGLEGVRRSIGQYSPTAPAATVISPTHVLLCGHCVGAGPEREDYVVLWDPTTQTFIGNLVRTVAPVGSASGQDFHTRLYWDRDVRIAKIVGTGRFPVHYTHYLNPYSFQSYIRTTGQQNSNEDLAVFHLNQQGIFALGLLSFNKLNNIVDNGSFVPQLDPNFNVGLKYEKIKDITQQKLGSARLGSSGTNYMFYTKDAINLWPGGAYAGQYIYNAWKRINNKFLVDEVNQYLRAVNEPELIEYTNFDLVYRISDFIDEPEPPENPPEEQIGILISTDQTPSAYKHILNIFPYSSRKQDTQNKNYTQLGFKPGILLQAAELNELQENIVLQQTLTLSLSYNWPKFGKKYQHENVLDFTIYETLSGRFDEVYEFPIPNLNYCVPQNPSLIKSDVLGNAIFITLSSGWYNVPVRNENIWCFMEGKTVSIPLSGTVDTKVYLTISEEVVPSSFIPSDEGYDFNDKSSKFLNPITDGADRVKINLDITTSPENNAVPILNIRRGTDTVIGSNRILVQTMNKYKINDINI